MIINKKRLLKRFIKYVKVDSVSKDEKKFALLIKKELAVLGVKSREDRAGLHIRGNCGNILGTLKGSVKKAKRLMFNAHIDTVITGRNIRPRVRDGVIKSDGRTILGADNKAGVAVMIEALKVIKERRMPHGDIDIIFTVAEEIGLCGSKFIDKRALKADMGFVLDGGSVDEMINRAPSQDSIEVKITGKAAHAGVHPEQGINAIKVAGAALSKMRLGRIDQETTANIGIIEGGSATNIVPETVVLKGEARSHNGAKLRRQVKHMRDSFRKACRRSGARLEFRVTPSYRSFRVSPASGPMRTAVAAAKAMGIRPKVKATGGGSDANMFNSMGLPCLIIGVGAHNVHTNREKISLSDMVKGCELVLNIMREGIK